MKIVFPELAKNSIAQEAIQAFPDIEFFDAPDLSTAAEMLASSQADSLISGLDYSSRDVLLACKAHIPLKSPYFSSCFVGKKDGKYLIVADGGVNKIPTKEQLYTIVEDTARTCEEFLEETPKIAMLSYSTKGSGGKNPDLEKFYYVIDEIHRNHPDWRIDGEMQLDAAIIPRIGEKKIGASSVAGHANVLITPDLNSGNILYKSMEHLGGWIMAGPILQGFATPIADLSRGSTVEDVKLTIEVIKKQFERTRK